MSKPILSMTPWQRLARIAEIIEAVDDRCLAADGPVSPTLSEMSQPEISEIYALACCPPLVVSEEGCREISADLRATNNACGCGPTCQDRHDCRYLTATPEVSDG